MSTATMAALGSSTARKPPATRLPLPIRADAASPVSHRPESTTKIRPRLVKGARKPAAFPRSGRVDEEKTGATSEPRIKDRRFSDALSHADASDAPRTHETGSESSRVLCEAEAALRNAAASRAQCRRANRRTDGEPGHEKGDDPLMIAIAGNDVAKVARLLEVADPNMRNDEGLTPLMLAARNGNAAIVGLLMECERTNPLLQDKHKRNAMMIAAVNGHGEAIATIFDKLDAMPDAGAMERLRESIVTACDDGKNNLFMLAAQGGQTNVLVRLSDYFESAGQLVNARNEEGHTPLGVASRNGDCATIAALNALGATPLEADCKLEGGHQLEGVSPLVWAAGQGKLDVFEALIGDGAWTGQEKLGNEKTRSHLRRACQAAFNKGHHDIVQFLLNTDRLGDVNRLRRDPKLLPWLKPRFSRYVEHGPAAMVAALHCIWSAPANKDWIRPVESPALVIAAGRGEEKAIVTLLAAGARLDGKNAYGRQALMAAIENQQWAVAEQLLIKNVEAGDGTTPADNARPLTRAILMGAPQELIELMLWSGAEINYNGPGMSALQAAASVGNVGLVNFLLVKGARVNHRTVNGESALSFAVRVGHADIVRMLLLAGAKYKRANRSGWTPLMIAAVNGNDKIVAHLLAQKNMDEARPAGPALVRYVRRKWKSVRELLSGSGRQNGRTVRTMDTPLMLAAAAGHLEVARKLIKAGFPADHRNENGGSALFNAIGNDKPEVAQLLLENDCDANQATVSGVTPLMLAAERGDIRVVELLLARSADKDARNGKKENALTLAVRHEHRDVIARLIGQGAPAGTGDATVAQAPAEATAATAAPVVKAARAAVGPAEVSDDSRPELAQSDESRFRDTAMMVGAAFAKLAEMTGRLWHFSLASALVGTSIPKVPDAIRADPDSPDEVLAEAMKTLSDSYGQARAAKEKKAFEEHLKTQWNEILGELDEGEVLRMQRELYTMGRNSDRGSAQRAIFRLLDGKTTDVLSASFAQVSPINAVYHEAFADLREKLGESSDTGYSGAPALFDIFCDWAAKVAPANKAELDASQAFHHFPDHRMSYWIDALLKDFDTAEEMNGVYAALELVHVVVIRHKSKVPDDKRAQYRLLDELVSSISSHRGMVDDRLPAVRDLEESKQEQIAAAKKRDRIRDEVGGRFMAAFAARPSPAGPVDRA